MSRVRDVGIVMPVYLQKDRYLKAAIRSVLQQSYKYFKFVIVIDGAPPHTEHLIRRLVKRDSRVRVIVHRHNHGIAASLNRGFRSLYRRKHIRYLTWVSSDNVYYPDYLRELRRKLRRSKSKLGLAYSTFDHIDGSDNSALSAEAHEDFKQWQDQPRENLLDICFIGASFMYKRRYAERAGAYDMEPVEDYDYWLRLTDHCDIGYIPNELMAYRMNSDYSVSRTLTSSTEEHRRWRHVFQLLKLNARTRRGIQPETVIVVPVREVNDAVVERIEQLYEQHYSNYHVMIVDQTRDGSAATLLAKISDPRVRFIQMPNASLATAVRASIEAETRSFLLVYSVHQPHKSVALDHMAHALRQADDSAVGAIMSDDAQAVQFLGPAEVQTIAFDTLYRMQHIYPLV